MQPETDLPICNVQTNVSVSLSKNSPQGSTLPSFHATSSTRTRTDLKCKKQQNCKCLKNQHAPE